MEKNCLCETEKSTLQRLSTFLHDYNKQHNTFKKIKNIVTFTFPTYEEDIEHAFAPFLERVKKGVKLPKKSLTSRPSLSIS